MNKIICLKIDVDTKVGLDKGVPRILDVLDRLEVKASFFIPSGPDRTGMTITRIFRMPEIIAKAVRTSALKIYGARTLFNGTLLWPPNMLKGSLRVIREITESGHEIGLHAYDHFKWQDYLYAMSEENVGNEVEKALGAFLQYTAQKPEGFASPGWKYNLFAASALAGSGFIYTSNTRGKTPYFPDFGGRTVELLELPTTMRTLDEMTLPVTAEDIEEKINLFMGELNESGLNVYTLHSEIEGNLCVRFFEEFLLRLRKEGYSFAMMRDMASDILSKKSGIRVSRVENAKIENRAGVLACQGGDI